MGFWSRNRLASTNLGRTMLSQLQVPMQERPRGWIFVGSFISAVPDVMYPWDRDVVRALRQMDRGIVPVFCKMVYLPPYSHAQRDEVVFPRHGLALYRPVPAHEAEPFPIEMPTQLGSRDRFPRPNMYLVTLLEEPTIPGTELPGGYIPMGWETVNWVAQGIANAKEHQRVMRRAEEAALEDIRRQEAARSDDAAQREKDFESYSRKQIDRISDSEWMSYQDAVDSGEIGPSVSH